MNPQDESQLPIELDLGLDALFCIFIFFQFQHLNDAMAAIIDAAPFAADVGGAFVTTTVLS